MDLRKVWKSMSYTGRIRDSRLTVWALITSFVLYQITQNGKACILTLPFFFICGKIVGIMAKKNNTKRKLVGLVSEESGVRAYYTKKNTMNTPDKLSLKKYDPVLRKHVVFTETKKNLGRNEVKEKKR